jgi:glycosyltransferase involved in cell wall biosynthesis
MQIMRSEKNRMTVETKKLSQKEVLIQKEVPQEEVPTPRKGGIDWNEISSGSEGGTEQMGRRLESSIDPELLENFQIILSRVRDLDETKVRVLWLHDLPDDPESKHLDNEGWKKFHKIVFVSYWQREWYIRKFNIPYSKTIVIQNAITPIETKAKPKNKINLIYHTTPHRSLNILVPVFDKLAEKYDDIHLDVYSSFKIYGWEKRDEPFEELFKFIKEHPKMTYHGFQPNEKVRKALTKAHIYAYPNTWMETSCLSLIEAMSAEVMCVHPDYGALPETAANWTMMYPYDENPQHHAQLFYNVMDSAIQIIKEGDEATKVKLKGAKSYCDLYYNWEVKKHQWEAFLNSIKDAPRALEQKSTEMFVYKSG